MTEAALDDDFYREHRQMVLNIVHRTRLDLGLTLDVKDLEAYAYQGLLEAKARFDPSKGLPFSAFAHHRIRGALLDGLGKMGPLPRSTNARVKRERALNDAAEDRSSARAVEGAPVEMGDALSAFDEVMGQLAVVVMAAAAADEERRGTPEAKVIALREHARLEKAIDELPEREQKVIRGMYFEERLLDDIAAEIGVKRSMASRIHTTALARLRKRLG